MLSGEGNENGEKTTICLISKTATLQVQHSFFVHFFTVVLHDYNEKLPETSWLHVLWRKCRTCFCSLFFSTVAHFHPGGRQHFLFSHRRYKISCCSSNKKCLLSFFYLALALFLVELRWPVALLSLFLFSKFVDMTINLNLTLQTTGYKNIFRFPYFTLQLSLQDGDGHTLSRQNNPTFGTGLHEVGVQSAFLRYITTKFSRMDSFLTYGAPLAGQCARELCYQ